jgi:hypothetical protein
MVITGSLVSRNNGLSWEDISLNTSPSVLASNGREIIFANDASGNSVIAPLSQLNSADAFTSISFGSGLSALAAIQWNGRYWLAGGTSASTGQIVRSYDGYNWLPVATGLFSANDQCYGIAWNGTMWVISGKASAGGTILGYSVNGISWTSASTTLGGGRVVWTGSAFICAGPYANDNITKISTSTDGATWTSAVLSNSAGEVHSIAWNGSAVVVSANNTSGVGSLLVSYNGSTWTAVGGSVASGYKGVCWSGAAFIANTGTTAIRYSYDGTNWTSTAISALNGNSVLWTQPDIGTMRIQMPTLVGGDSSANTMYYSSDGVVYRSLGNSVFSGRCHSIAWNGQLWVAGGKGDNTLAYSYDGLKWVGLGSTVFSDCCYKVARLSLIHI